MVQRIFENLVDTNFFNPNDWRPVGVPQSGDGAGIIMAAAVAQGTLPSGVSIGLATFAANGRFARLTLQDATVPVGTTINEITDLRYASLSGPSSLSFAGTVVNEGTLIFGGDVQSVALPSGTTLTNDGTIDVNGSSPQFSVGGANVTFVNDGLIRVVNPSDQSGQLAVLGPAIGGTGTLSVSVYSGLELGGAVGSGQTLPFVGGVGADASVQIDQPSLFAGTIGGFVSGDMLTLAITAATSVSYVASGVGLGTLQIYDGASTPVASLQFSGVYAASSFSLSESGSSLVITTNVTNASTGSTAVPTSSGVYRFFDTSDGTHFYTASVAERDSVLVGRPDLLEESNEFGAVTTASGSTESVYRFFDTVHGTHFFTASAAERDQVIATRSDLTYEPSATFLEDANPQTGDVAVYRLFSTVDGTHLYTGSAAELAALTTPGGAGYRAALVSEGVSFYAPGGSYT